jgi:hypothetical protein
MERWKEFNDKTLVPPCVIQHDIIRDEHLIWLWDGELIHGPLSRKSYDENEIIGKVENIKNMVFVSVVDPINAIIADKEAEVVALREENTKLKSDLSVAMAAIGTKEEPLEEVIP